MRASPATAPGYAARHRPLRQLRAASSRCRRRRGHVRRSSQAVPDESDWEWVEIDTARSLRPGMFVAQVVGKSMEPRVPDGAYCLFASPVTGTRQGRTVLVQLRDAVDPDTGERFTVKRYRSEKSTDEDGWRHVRILLEPVNPAFAPD